MFPRDKQGVENEDLVETGISVDTLKDSTGDSTWEYVGEFSEPKMSPRLNVDIRFVTLFFTRFRGRWIWQSEKSKNAKQIQKKY